MIAPLKATDQLNIDDIKEEFQAFRKRILTIESKTSSYHSKLPLSQVISNKHFEFQANVIEFNWNLALYVTH